MIPLDSPALGPQCVCPSDALDDGRHALDCELCAPHRCQVRGCEYVAVSGGECAMHEVRL